GIRDRAGRDGSVRGLRNVSADVIGGATVAQPPPAPPVAPMPQPGVEALLPGPIPAALGRGRAVPLVALHPRLVAVTSPSAATSEQYRALRTKLVHAESTNGTGLVLVTSPGRGDGKSLTAANLALTLAQDLQQRVCLVDANLRHPQVHKPFGLPEGPGLSEILSGQALVADTLLALDAHHLSFLPAGAKADHPAELLGVPAMRRTLLTLRSAFDRVIIDAPAAAPLADVGILTPLVDSVVLVVRAGVTTRPDIGDAIGSIEDSKLLGIVLNDAHAG